MIDLVGLSPLKEPYTGVYKMWHDTDYQVTGRDIFLKDINSFGVSPTAMGYLRDIVPRTATNMYNNAVRETSLALSDLGRISNKGESYYNQMLSMLNNPQFNTNFGGLLNKGKRTASKYNKTLSKNLGTFRNDSLGVLKNINSDFSNLVNMRNNFMSLGNTFSTTRQGIKGILSGMSGDIGGLNQELASKIGNLYTQTTKNIKSGVGSIKNEMVSNVNNMFNKVTEGLSGLDKNARSEISRYINTASRRIGGLIASYKELSGKAKDKAVTDIKELYNTASEKINKYTKSGETEKAQAWKDIKAVLDSTVGNIKDLVDISLKARPNLLSTAEANTFLSNILNTMKSSMSGTASDFDKLLASAAAMNAASRFGSSYVTSYNRGLTDIYGNLMQGIRAGIAGIAGAGNQAMASRDALARGLMALLGQAIGSEAGLANTASTNIANVVGRYIGGLADVTRGGIAGYAQLGSTGASSVSNLAGNMARALSGLGVAGIGSLTQGLSSLANSLVSGLSNTAGNAMTNLGRGYTTAMQTKAALGTGAMSDLSGLARTQIGARANLNANIYNTLSKLYGTKAATNADVMRALGSVVSNISAQQGGLGRAELGLLGEAIRGKSQLGATKYSSLANSLGNFLRFLGTNMQTNYGIRSNLIRSIPSFTQMMTNPYYQLAKMEDNARLKAMSEYGAFMRQGIIGESSRYSAARQSAASIANAQSRIQQALIQKQIQDELLGFKREQAENQYDLARETLNSQELQALLNSYGSEGADFSKLSDFLKATGDILGNENTPESLRGALSNSIQNLLSGYGLINQENTFDMQALYNALQGTPAEQSGGSWLGAISDTIKELFGGGGAEVPTNSNNSGGYSFNPENPPAGFGVIQDTETGNYWVTTPDGKVYSTTP